MIRLSGHMGRGSCFFSTSKHEWKVLFVSHMWMIASSMEDTIFMLMFLVLSTETSRAVCHRRKRTLEKNAYEEKCNNTARKGSFHIAPECFCGSGHTPGKVPTQISLMPGFCTMCGLQDSQIQWVNHS